MIVSLVVTTGAPPRSTETRLPAAEVTGSIARSPFAPLAGSIVKWSLWPLQSMPPKEDWLRPSSQVSICRAETIGTPRARAEATIASEPAEVASSVCMLAVKTP